MVLPDGRGERLEALLAARDLEAVWFAGPDNFAWLTGGSNVVDRASDVGVAAAGYDGELRVVTDNIEAERLAVEELPADINVESVAWHESSLAEAVAARTPRPAAADFGVDGVADIDGRALRTPLTAGDCDRYRALAAETATALEAVCRGADSTDTERAVAADLRGRLAARGIDAPVALVGGSERARRYRHYTPTEASLGRYALVSVTARRGGLYASCTRTVAFDPPAWLAARHHAAARVETTALAATQTAAQEGATAGDVFDAIRTAYAAVGHEDEWRNHHQGGATGFAGREWFATPESDQAVEQPMAYAWNPTIQGAKSEDTVLVDDTIEVMTRTGDWPTIEVDAVEADLTLQRPAILEA